MKKTIVLLLFIVLLIGLIPTVFAFEIDPGKVEIIKSSNGDGYTPFDLKWEDGTRGRISFGVQSPDLGSNYGYMIVLFCDGYDIAETSVGSWQESQRAQENLAEFMKSPGEYVFVVYTEKNDDGTQMGKAAKSEPFVLGEQGVVQNAPISLSVDVRSANQAVITITDPNLLNAYPNSDLFDRLEYRLSFGDYTFTFRNTFSPGQTSNNENLEFDPWHNTRGSDQTGFRHACRMDGNKIIFELQKALMGTENRHNELDQSFDFRNLDAYFVEAIARSNGKEERLSETTFSKADVMDTRNLGQIYRIDREWPIKRFVQGNIKQEQYEALFFTPNTNNYIIAETKLNSADVYADPSFKASGAEQEGAFSVDMTVLAWFDESDRLLGMVERFHVPNYESGYAIVNIWRRLGDATTAYFKPNPDGSSWLYRPVVTKESGYGQGNIEYEYFFLDSNVIVNDTYSGMVQGTVYKDALIKALETGHTQYVTKYTITENRK